MATTATSPAADNAAAQAPSRKRPLLMIAIITIVLLVIAGGAGAYLYLKPAQDKAAAPVVVAPPVFMELESFTVNLNDDHLLQSSFSLQLRSEEDAEQLKRYLPQVRSRLLLLMSAHAAESLKTPEGKEKLAKDIAATLQQAYATGLKPPAVSGVYFTAFVIQ